MAALAASVNLEEKEGKLISHPIVASDIIFKGALVKHNAAGYLAPCAAEAGAVFAGVAFEEIDNSAGAAGDLNCRVEKEGSYLMTVAAFSIADVGSAVYASDDATISTTQGANEQQVGYVVEFVSATQVWVKINSSAI